MRFGKCGGAMQSITNQTQTRGETKSDYSNFAAQRPQKR
jgi:hypothetical protein